MELKKFIEPLTVAIKDYKKAINKYDDPEDVSEERTMLFEAFSHLVSEVRQNMIFLNNFTQKDVELLLQIVNNNNNDIKKCG